VSDSPGARFRALLAKGQVVLPGVFNAITALQARACGHTGLYLSGAGVTNALTGYPDIALLTLTEFAQQARYVCRAVPDTPIIADADTGHGEALNVMRTVEEYEHVGLAGLHLEDQLAPKRCGHLDGKQLIEPEAMAAKLRAAVVARQDPAGRCHSTGATLSGFRGGCAVSGGVAECRRVCGVRESHS
jgi:2-methylisocitrate lyase-like PEP mutase family enzyme